MTEDPVTGDRQLVLWVELCQGASRSTSRSTVRCEYSCVDIRANKASLGLTPSIRAQPTSIIAQFKAASVTWSEYIKSANHSDPACPPVCIQFSECG